VAQDLKIVDTKRVNKGVDVVAINITKEWAPPSKNLWTGKPFSPRYFDILEKRKILPAWNARKEVLTLVT
jgi:hypothetical protein